MGAQNFTALQNSERVTLYNLIPTLKFDLKNPPKTVGSPLELTDNQRKELFKLLASDKNYDFIYTKRTPFIPTILIKYAQGAHETSVYIDLTANQVKFIGADKSKLLDFDKAQKEFKHYFHDLIGVTE